MKGHSKHTKLFRKKLGFFSENEIAILGNSCSEINKFVSQIAAAIQEKHKIVYIDASHNDELEKLSFDSFIFHKSQNTSISKNIVSNKYSNNVLTNQYDIAFVNGNHYQAKKQIIFLNPEKENSINKRLSQIDEILFFVTLEKSVEVFDCLKDKFPHYDSIPIFNISEVHLIVNQVESFVYENNPTLNGLVLTGGKSTRMGLDKAHLKYFGKPHSIYLADLLKKQSLKVFYSVRDEEHDFDNVIKDKFIDLGPFGAICSAFMKNPDQAYLILATDLPFIDDFIINTLISNRDTSKIATAIKGFDNQFPEPLITIWEPKSYPVLLSYLALGISCPRKVLINEDIKIVEVDNKYLTNVNTYEEYVSVKKSLE